MQLLLLAHGRRERISSLAEQLSRLLGMEDDIVVVGVDESGAPVAGAIGVSTDAQASWWGGRGIGTVPHGLIAAYGGDTALAAEYRTLAERFAGWVDAVSGGGLLLMRLQSLRDERIEWDVEVSLKGGKHGGT